MITLNQIADLVIHDFEGGLPSQESKLDRRDIVKKARHFLPTVLKPVLWGKISEGDRSTIPQAIYTYELSLQEDSQDRKYLAIPDLYMALHDNRGIHRLYVKGNPYADFVPMNNPGVSAMLPHSKLKGVQYYYVEGMNIIIGPGSIAKKADKMILQIINPAPDALGENDALPMLPEQLAELIRLVKMDYAPFANVQTDYLNNQNANIR